MSTANLHIHPKLSQCKVCSKQTSIIDITVTKHQDIDGCEVVKCNNCHSFWYVCLKHNNRFSMSNKSKMVKHFSVFHKQADYKDISFIPTNQTNTESEIANIDDESSSNDVNFMSYNDTDHTPVPSPPQSPIINSKMQTTNQTDLHQTNILQQQIQHVNDSFFGDEISSYGNGFCGICANAFAQSYHCDFKSSKHEASFHLQATYLCSQLTENQQKQLASLMNDIITKRFDTTKVPNSIADIRKFYTTG